MYNISRYDFLSWEPTYKPDPPPYVPPPPKPPPKEKTPPKKIEEGPPIPIPIVPKKIVIKKKPEPIKQYPYIGTGVFKNKLKIVKEGRPITQIIEEPPILCRICEVR